MSSRQHRSPLVRLQRVGTFRGTPVSELREGDVLVWNWGYTTDVLRIERTAARSSVILHLRDPQSGTMATRRKALTTLVVLASCGGGCTADDDDPTTCARCGRRLMSGVRKLPVVEIDGRPYYRDDRLREYRAVDDPHDRRPL